MAAILFPIFVRVREKGRQTACGSNLRQLGIAVTQYAQENDGFLPPYNNRQDPDGPLNHEVWADQSSELVASMRPYTGTNEIWFCPSDSYARIGGSPIDLSTTYINHRFSSYLFIFFHSDPHPIHPRPLQTRRSPSEYPLFWENSWGCKANDDSINRTLYSHNGMFNAVMFDGHLRSYRWDDPTCQSTTDMQ